MAAIGEAGIHVATITHIYNSGGASSMPGVPQGQGFIVRVRKGRQASDLTREKHVAHERIAPIIRAYLAEGDWEYAFALIEFDTRRHIVDLRIRQ